MLPTARKLYAASAMAATALAGCSSTRESPTMMAADARPENDDAAPPICTAGETRCDGTDLWTCELGAFVPNEACAVECDAPAECDPCAPELLGNSYIGCEYYAVVTPNSVRSGIFHFAVAISNTSRSPTVVTIEG